MRPPYGTIVTIRKNSVGGYYFTCLNSHRNFSVQIVAADYVGWAYDCLQLFIYISKQIVNGLIHILLVSDQHNLLVGLKCVAIFIDEIVNRPALRAVGVCMEIKVEVFVFEQAPANCRFTHRIQRLEYRPVFPQYPVYILNGHLVLPFLFVVEHVAALVTAKLFIEPANYLVAALHANFLHISGIKQIIKQVYPDIHVYKHG